MEVLDHFSNGGCGFAKEKSENKREMDSGAVGIESEEVGVEREKCVEKYGS